MELEVPAPSAVLSHITISGSSSKLGSSHCRSSSSAGMNRLSGFMLAEGAIALSRESALVNDGCVVSLNDARTAGGGMSPTEPERVAVMVAEAAGVADSGGRDTGRIEISRAGVLAVDVLGTLLVPLVISVNSATRPLLS